MSSHQFSLVRIAGTAYSGSTTLDLMLANANDAFSCGEIDALFRPYRMPHFNPECGCGDQLCGIWQEIREAGEKNWPSKVVYLFPQVKFIIDSSKDLNWIFDQNAICRKAGIPVINLLIWKTPADYAYSQFKRGKLKGWLRRYLLYHKRYLSIVDAWIGIPYIELATKPAVTLNSLCSLLGMAYKDGREHYWMKKHHSLFGSHSAKLHLHNEDTHNYKLIAQHLKSLKPNLESGIDYEVTHHKSIYYNDESLERMPQSVAKEIEHSHSLHDLVSYLERRGISHIDIHRTDLESLGGKLQLTSPGIWLHYLKYKRLGLYLKCILRRLFFIL